MLTTHSFLFRIKFRQHLDSFEKKNQAKEITKEERNYCHHIMAYLRVRSRPSSLYRSQSNL